MRAPFWQTRFYDFNVWTDKKRVEKLRYMHRNPVKRGLAPTPEECRWSSYRFYLLDEPGPVRVNEGWDVGQDRVFIADVMKEKNLMALWTDALREFDNTHNHSDFAGRFGAIRNLILAAARRI